MPKILNSHLCKGYGGKYKRAITPHVFGCQNNQNSDTNWLCTNDNIHTIAHNVFKMYLFSIMFFQWVWHQEG